MWNVSEIFAVLSNFEVYDVLEVAVTDGGVVLAAVAFTAAVVVVGFINCCNQEGTLPFWLRSMFSSCTPIIRKKILSFWNRQPAKLNWLSVQFPKKLAFAFILIGYVIRGKMPSVSILSPDCPSWASYIKRTGKYLLGGKRRVPSLEFCFSQLNNG